MLKKRNRFNCHIVISPLIVLCIILMVYLIKRIYPFGSQTICNYDLSYNLPFYAYFINAFKNFSITNIFYSNYLIGGLLIFGRVYNLFFNVLGYMYLLCYDIKELILYMSFVFIVKCCLASITMNYSLNRIFNKKANNLYNTIFSIIWALSGFVLLNYTILEWIDIIIVFPIFCVGIKHLVDGKSIILYVISLELMFMISIELTVMVLIALLFCILISFLFNIQINDKKVIIFKLGIATILGILISSIVLVPLIDNIINSSRFIETEFKEVDNVFATKLIHFLMSSIILFGVQRSLVYVKKDIIIKIILLSILILCIIPIFFEGINRQWHGGSYRCFPQRIAFVSIYLMIILTYYYFVNYLPKEKSIINKIESRIIKNILIILVLLMLLVSFLIQTVFIRYVFNDDNKAIVYDGIDSKAVLYVLLSVIIKIIVFNILFKDEYVIFKYITIVLVVVESFIFVYSLIGIKGNDEKNKWYQNDFEIERKIEDNNIENIFNLKDDSGICNTNIGMALNKNIFNGNVLFDESIIRAYRKLFYSYKKGANFSGQGGTILSDYIMNNKYHIIENNCFIDKSILKNKYKLIDSDFFESSDIKIDLYESDFNFVNAIKYNKENNIRKYQTNNSFIDNTNFIWNNVFNANNNVLTKVDGNISNIVFDKNENCYIWEAIIQINGTKNIYYDFNKGTENDFVKITKDDKLLTDEFYSEYSNIKDLGCYKDEKIHVVVSKNEEFNTKDIELFLFDLDEFNSVTRNLEVIDCSKKDNIITYYTTSNGNESLLIPLWYNKNWKVSINGNPVDCNMALDGLISVDLKEGENNIRLEFTCPLLYIGGVISLIGIGCLILVNRFSIIFDNKIIQNIAYVLFYIVSIGFLVYINIGGIVMQFLEL